MVKAVKGVTVKTTGSFTYRSGWSPLIDTMEGMFWHASFGSVGDRILSAFSGMLMRSFTYRSDWSPLIDTMEGMSWHARLWFSGWQNSFCTGNAMVLFRLLAWNVAFISWTLHDILISFLDVLRWGPGPQVLCLWFQDSVKRVSKFLSPRWDKVFRSVNLILAFVVPDLARVLIPQY